MIETGVAARTAACFSAPLVALAEGATSDDAAATLFGNIDDLSSAMVVGLLPLAVVIFSVRSSNQSTKESINTELRAVKDSVKTDLAGFEKGMKTELQATKDGINIQWKSTKEGFETELQATKNK